MTPLPFHKITLNSSGGLARVCVYNRGCNFRCRGCAYKMRPEVLGEGGGLRLSDVESTLERLKPDRVHFLGGEPTTNPLLPRVARYAKEELGALTKMGHTNGSGRIPDFIDEAAFSIKAYTEGIHEDYTGSDNDAVLDNFIDAYRRGIGVSASTVLIPGAVDAEEVGRVAEFVGGIDRRIRFHITAYIPVPGASYQAPKMEDLETASSIALKHLDVVTCRRLSRSDFFSLRHGDELYRSLQVA